MAPGTWKENIAKDYSKEKAPWQKGKEKILSLIEPMNKVKKKI